VSFRSVNAQGGRGRVTLLDRQPTVSVPLLAGKQCLGEGEHPITNHVTLARFGAF